MNFFLLVVIGLIILFFGIQAIRVISDASVLRNDDLKCIAGCGLMCSNDLRSKLKDATRQEADRILEEYNYQKFSKEEISEEVSRCQDEIEKGIAPEWIRGPFYPYNELLKN